MTEARVALISVSAMVCEIEDFSVIGRERKSRTLDSVLLYLL